MAYRKFVIVSHLRSGTHLLRTALESHPAVVCQTEVFNSDNRRLPYPLTTPTVEVLRRWVYRQFPDTVACVGFTLQVYHPWGLRAFPGIRENPAWGDVWTWLSRMKAVRIIHLRRENSLRRHLSHVMARRSRVWHAWDPDRVKTVSHLGPPPDGDGPGSPREPVTLDAARLEVDFEETERLHEAVTRRFRDHALCSISYESLTRDFDARCREVQDFLQLPLAPLTAAVGKLETRSLADAIANYGDLKRHFADTRWAAFFED
ncbi:MAG: hypothetical protein JNM75_08560 [Rhodospirillales bacterium]|nr:hypothetical protein [Rhodospirillales bacterium]